MLTPKFYITQDDRTVTITITAPFSNINDLDSSIDGDCFIFQCTPYYLRLCLPGRIIETSKTKVIYDEEKGEFRLRYEKETPNEDFRDLDKCESLTKVDFEEIEETEFDITEPQKKFDECLDTKGEYGFALRGGYKFQNLTQDFADVFKIDPFEVKFADRKALRIKKEDDDFNDEHYAADFMDDAEIQEIIRQETPWSALKKEEVEFTQDELSLIDSLGKIEYNLTVEQIAYAENSLIEILFAYCYDGRTTFYESTCESHWTIRTLSASLSYFDSFSTSKEALQCVYRRSLIYPLYRSFKLNEIVFKDLKRLLYLGNKFIVKSLIEIYNIFLDDDLNSYVLNNLFIKDYIRFMVNCDEEFYRRIVDDVKQVQIQKNDLGLNLEEIELELLEDSLDETEKIDFLATQMNNIEISDEDSCSDSSTSVSSSNSSESE